MNFCSSPKPKQNIDSCVTNLNSLQNLLGLRIDEIPEFYTKCYDVQDTIFESDDGVEWPGKNFVHNGKIYFIAETNWQNTKKISQIELFSSAIEVRKGISTKKEFKEISSQILDEIPSMPDGYLALKDKENNHVWYFLDIDKHPELFYGIESTKKIPNNLIIDYILIK